MLCNTFSIKQCKKEICSKGESWGSPDMSRFKSNIGDLESYPFSLSPEPHTQSVKRTSSSLFTGAG